MKKQLLQLILVVPLILMLCSFISCQKKAEEIEAEKAEEMKALMDRYLEIWNEGNFDIIEELIDPEYVARDSASPEDIVGFEGLKALVTLNRTSFPDFHITADEMIVKGDRTISLFTTTGTNTGPLLTPEGELPPTGKKVRISGVCISKIVNGKIKEDWIYYNVLEMMQQLGFTLALPQPPEEKK